MLTQGPIPALVHGADRVPRRRAVSSSPPFLFGFDAATATAASIVVGLVLLAFTAMSDHPDRAGQVASPSALHVTADIVSRRCCWSPCRSSCDFRDETAPTALFIIVGVLHLLVTIGDPLPRRHDDRQR